MNGMRMVVELGSLGGQDSREFLHFWGREASDRDARILGYAHLRDVQLGDKRYDLTDPQQFKEFKQEVTALGGLIAADGVVAVPGGRSYDIRKPAEFLKLKADGADGVLDSKNTAATTASATDGIDKAPAPGPTRASAPPTPASPEVPGADAADRLEIPNFRNMSWSQIINFLRQLLAGKEDAAKGKMEALGREMAKIDAASDNPEDRVKREDLKQQLSELTDMVKDIENCMTMLSNLIKGQHELTTALIRNLAA